LRIILPRILAIKIANGIVLFKIVNKNLILKTFACLPNIVLVSSGFFVRVTMRLALFRAFVVVLPLVATATAAHADLVVSANPTKNVTCSGGVCTSTSNNGVLNVSDLQNMLASGNVKVMSKGGGAHAGDMKIAAALTWVSSNTLTLDSYHSIVATQPVTIAGSGGLTLMTNDGGAGGGLSFAKKGKITFWSLSSNLTINGATYTLVNNIATLASNVVANNSGSFALAADYDASVDGTYGKTPISQFFGNFEGLGNTISNLTLDIPAHKNGYAGLFGSLSGGLVENLNLIKANIKGGRYLYIGSLVGTSTSVLSGISVSGQIVFGGLTTTGGIAGENGGTIINSHSTARMRAVTSPCSDAPTGGCYVGGLVGLNFEGGQIRDSYTTGAISGVGWSGGLASLNYGEISNCYATGSVTGAQVAVVGGFVGVNESGGMISDSYSTGGASGGLDSKVGAFVGYDSSTSGSITNSYWDTTTSGISDPSKGAGNISNDPGITGRTTVQLQAGLPTGFASSIWAESATINSGLPYLLNIPPP
jgi:hypothetical protein